MFVRVARVRPVALLRLLEAASAFPGSWLDNVRADFDWLASVALDPGSWKAWSLDVWARHAHDDPKAAKKLIGTICRQGESNMCDVWATTKSQRALAQACSCPECGKQCKNSQVLGAHRAQKHGIKRLTRYHVDGTHRVACLIEFHDRERLIQHLERASPDCRAVVLSRLPRLSDEVVKRLDEESTARVRELRASGKHRVHASLPRVRLHGPLWPSLAPRHPKSNRRIAQAR